MASADVLIHGYVHRQPELRIAKTGREFVTTKIKVDDGASGWDYWAVNTFDADAMSALLCCNIGDAISARGALRTEIWTPANQPPRINLTVSANQIIVLSSDIVRAKADAETLFTRPVTQQKLPLPMPKPVGTPKREIPF